MPEDSGLNILLIEDSDDHAELVRRAFARSRDAFNLVRASSCSAATELGKNIYPSVIICDYLLPDGNGLNLYKHQLKASYPDVPALLLTSQGDELVTVDALKSGMIDYLVKSDEVLISLPDVCRSIIRENDQKLENRKHVEALRESEERYRGILHAAIDGFWLADTQNRLIEVNEAYRHMSGYSEQELLTMTIADLEATMTADDVAVQTQMIITQGEARFSSRHRRKDGTIFDVEVSVKYQPVDEKMVVVLRDITERKLAEESLLLTQFSIDKSSDCIFWMTPDAHIVDVNEAACRSLGYSRDELLQLSVPDIDPFYNFDVWRHSVTELKKQLSQTFETVHSTKDGTQFPVEIVTNLILFGAKELICANVRNITERKQAEEDKLAFEQQLQHTQKLESLGVLSGGIAHDFNNILAIIIGNCGLAKMDSENTADYIPEIENAAERAAGLCRQMLAYAGKTQLAKTQVNLKLLLDEMITMLTSSLPQNAVIKQDISANIPAIHADASQIRQIVMNLIINSSEAIGEEQGEISVSLTRTTVPAGQTEKDYHGKAIPPGNYICLEVTDTGCGMDEKTKWRIFEPFYTTKFTGRGLGMSAVLGIINSHNGALQLFSQPGQGTTFKVYLPVQENGAAGAEGQATSTPPVPWQGSGTILLVEDEAQIRYIAKTLLTNFGFTVLEAANGKEALELYRQNTAEIRLVLTDMGMPVMNGYALVHTLKQINPDLPIIVSSSFGEGDISSKIPREAIAGLINKPYNPGQLREVLKSILKGQLPPTYPADLHERKE